MLCQIYLFHNILIPPFLDFLEDRSRKLRRHEMYIPKISVLIIFIEIYVEI